MQRNRVSEGTTVRARVDTGLKTEAEDVFKALGLSTSEAINLFLNQVRLQKGLPFVVMLPNALTRKVMEDTDRGKNLVEFGSIEELLEDLDT